MNWGKGIALVIVLFMAFIVSFVYRAFQNDTDLVRDDYYQHELNFETERESKQNYEKLQSEIIVMQKEEGVCVQFPNEIEPAAGGKIVFYRPDTKEYDREFALELDDSGLQVLDYDHFREGSYELSIEWESNNKMFIFEDNIQF